MESANATNVKETTVCTHTEPSKQEAKCSSICLTTLSPVRVESLHLKCSNLRRRTQLVHECYERKVLLKTTAHRQYPAASKATASLPVAVVCVSFAALAAIKGQNATVGSNRVIMKHV